MADLGIDLIAVGGDMNLLRAGARAALAAARSGTGTTSV
jgi:hypothetical protein